MNVNFLKGIGNRHLDAARLLWFISVLAGVIYAGVHLVLNKEFSIIDFGIGMGTLLAGGGAATAAKDLGVAKAAATSQSE